MLGDVAEVYLITNRINGRQYVGFSKVSMAMRWIQHTYAARSNRTTYAIHAAIAKHGPDAFERHVIGTGCAADMLTLERAMILALNTLAPNGYNLTEGGEFVEYSATARQRMSESAKARVTPALREQFAEAKRRYWLDPKNREQRARQVGEWIDREAHAAYMRELWKDPAYRAQQSASRREAWKKRKAQT